jgi:hypothetical protein
MRSNRLTLASIFLTFLACSSSSSSTPDGAAGTGGQHDGGAAGTTGVAGTTGSAGHDGGVAGHDGGAAGADGGSTAKLCPSRRGGALITLNNYRKPSDGTFCIAPYSVWITNNAFIDEAISRVGKGVGRIPSFKALAGSDCDMTINWHPDPEDVAFADLTTEVCDGCPFATGWAGSQFCPWAGEVVAVDDRRAIR